MMEYTSKEYFDRELAPQLPAISREKSELVDKIADRCTEYEKDFAKSIPCSAGRGDLRPERKGTLFLHRYI